MLTLIIPIFNEEKVLDRFFYQLKTLFDEVKFIDEIILINDGSTDNSLKKLEEFKLNHGTKVKVLSHNKNLGMGASIKTGVENSKNDIIAQVDGDNTHNLKDFIFLFKKFKDNDLDMIIGDRSKKIYKNFSYYFKPRNIGREIIRIISIILTGYKIKDINSGFRIYKKKIITENLNFLPNGFSLVSSITVLSINRNLKIDYMDINYDHRDKGSKIKPVKDFINFINLLIKVTIFTNPNKIFLPIFLILFTIGLLLIIIRLFFIKKFFFTGLMLILFSLIILFFGYVFEYLGIISKHIKK